MRQTRALGWLLLFGIGCGGAPAPAPAPAPRAAASAQAKQQTLEPGLTYPVSRRDALVETLHGVAVPDPYRWLENTTSAETRRWIDEQNRLTQSYLSAISGRDALRSRLRELWDYERFGLPVERAGRYFYTYNSGLQNQPVLYWLKTLAATPKLLLDPNLLAADGTVALKRMVPSRDGKLLAYALSRAGSDWMEWRVRRVDDGQDLPEVLSWSKFGGAAWTKDGRGFYYNRYDEPKPGAALEESNYYNKLYFHRVGQPQSEDTLIFERSDQKKWSFHPTTTRDGRYLVITIAQGTDPKYAVWYVDLTRPKSAPVPLFPELEAEYSFLGNRGSTFWFKTDLQAPRGRIVSVDIARKPLELRELVAQQPETLQEVERASGKLLINYLKDAHSELRVYAETGQLEQVIPLPGLGTVSLAEADSERSEIFYGFESFYEPRLVERFDVKRKQGQVFRQPVLKFEPAAYETRQVFFTSRDGTRLPMFLTHRKGLVLGPETPCLLYGYGGFGISVTPNFGAGNLAWVELGGVLATPNLRGGGEYGETWHEAGKRAQKQNVFDDFIAAAEYLLRERITSTPKLAILGRSNGGLLVGAMLAQRPELFGAALPGVGVMDMLRFHKFTIGWSWVDDYGSPDDAADFKVLYAYSPLHNLRPSTRYPATLITTADHDDRVVPAHSFKFAAALQHAQAGSAPTLIRIETRAGHGAGIPTDKKIDEVADQWAFLMRALALR